MNLQENEIIISHLPLVDGEPIEWIAEAQGLYGYGISPASARENLIAQLIEG